MTSGKVDTPDTSRGTTHGSDLAFIEARRLTFSREQHDVAVTVRDGCADQHVIFLQLNRSQANTSLTGELCGRRFLHGAIRRRHKDELILVIPVDGQDRRDALFFV